MKVPVFLTALLFCSQIAFATNELLICTGQAQVAINKTQKTIRVEGTDVKVLSYKEYDEPQKVEFEIIYKNYNILGSTKDRTLFTEKELKEAGVFEGFFDIEISDKLSLEVRNMPEENISLYCSTEIF